MGTPAIILASASKSRQKLLANSGLKFTVQPADVDEDAIKQVFQMDNSEGDPANLAVLLASTKAALVSESHPGSIVIGADQLLVFEGEIFSKATSMDIARDHLLQFGGKTHSLECAVCCVLDGKVIWTHTDRANLWMRFFSPEFVGHYLAETGDGVLASVGCYQLEGMGIQLFEKIEGNYFTILGLPLLPLLSFLRSRGAVET